MVNSQDNKTQAPAAKAEPVARISKIRDVGGDIFIDVEWLRPSACEIDAKLYTAHVAQADDVRDAARWRAFRARDEFDDLDFTDFQDQFREDADEVIDSAIAARTTSAAPADKEGK